MLFRKKKSFEDMFTEIQKDMIEIGLEYVNDNAQVVYIYGSCEGHTLCGDVFYKINDKILRKHKLNDAGNGCEYDVSLNVQKQVLQIINEDIHKIKDLCESNGRPMPTQIKLKYDVLTKSVNADYSYDLIYSDSNDKTFVDAFNEWFEMENSN